MVELLVAMFLFGVFGLSAVSLASSAFRDLGIESNLNLAALELNRALGLLSSELRMSSTLSPYLPGNNAALSDCSSAVAVTATTIKFFVVEDDPGASTTSGVQAYYVGYKYDSASQQLLRGEISVNSLTNCAVPATDPTTSAYAKPLAGRVVPVDTNSDGVAEAAFVRTGSTIAVNLGVSARGAAQLSKLQKLPTQAFSRVSI